MAGKKPTMRNTKKEIRDYLEKHDISYKKSMTKKELLGLMRRSKSGSKKTSKKSAADESFAVSKKTMYGAIAVIVIIVAAILVISMANNTQPDEPGTNGDVLTGEEVVATVNGEDITQAEVDSIQQQLAQSRGQQVTSDAALEQAVNQELLMQEVKEREMVPTQQEAEQQLSQVLQSQGQTLEQLKTSIEQQGQDYAAVIESYQMQIGVNNLVEEVVGPVNISDEQAMDFYDQNTQMFVQGNETMPYETVEPSIKDYLQQQVTNQVMGEFIDQLRQEAEITYTE